MKKLIPIALTLAVIVAIPACNTVHGAGKDVSSVGKAVSNTADKAK
ncbi:entericidin A/B family lipoprotein [Sphingomonas oryzagri]